MTAVEEEKLHVCSPHEGYNYFHCKSCRTVLCENCKSSHVEANHKISDAASYAFRFKERITKYKNDYINEVHIGEVKLRKYQLEIQNTIERTLLAFDLKIAGFLKMIRYKTEKRKTELYKELEDTLKKLNEEVKCNEYNEELDKIGIVVENIDQSRISDLNKNDLKKKFKDKKEKMNSLFRQGKRTSEKAKSFVLDCKEIEEIFKMYEQTTVNNLAKTYENEIANIKECEIKLHEKSQELRRENEKQVQIRQQNEAITRERTNLEEAVKELQQEKAKLNGEIDKLNTRFLATKKSVEMLEEENKRKQEQLEVLSSLITEKKEDIKRGRDGDGIKQEAAKKPESSKEVSYKEVKAVFDSTMLYIFDQKLTTLFLYHLVQKTVYKFNVIEYKIASNCGCVQIGDSFFVSGGFDTFNVQFSKRLLKLNLMEEEKQKLSAQWKKDMSVGKSQHKLVMLDLRYFYSLGGKSKEKKFLNTCERYDRNEDKWEPAPNLTEPKLNIGATSINGSAIFAFGGFKGVYCGTIEVLDLNDPKDKGKWKAVKVTNASGWAARGEVGCFQCSDKEIYVFGGIDQTGECNDEIIKFNAKEKVVSKTLWKLAKKEWFTMATPVRFNDKVLIAGFFGSDIHSFSEAEANTNPPSGSPWTLVDLKEWKLN